jgi:hypothetical protein
MQPDQPRVRKLLRKADRRWEILVGAACALISIASTALLVFMVYLVAWRNPRQYGTHDFLKTDTIAFLAVLLAIAIAFSVFATRLLQGKKSPQQRLMSPLVLRIWGVFFSAGSLVVLTDCLINHRWKQFPHLWELLVTSISMAVAAFALARASKDRNRIV